MTKEIPSKFVWTKMGTHAGEPLDNIIRRKMLECDAGEDKFANTFWWGVGDSRGPAILIHLADRDPEVLFSEMPSKPRSKDSHPGKCFIWTTYRVCDSDESSGYGGKSLHVPNNIIVCDSEKEKSGPIKRKNYYALVCGRPRQCEQSEMKPLYVDNMKNLKRDGNLGKKPAPKQTTGVVEYLQRARTAGTRYPVKMRANLVRPYFVELGTPTLLNDSQVRLIKEIGDKGKKVGEYRDVAREIRR